MRSLRVAPPGRVARKALWFFAAGIGLWSGLITFELHRLQVRESDAKRAEVRRQHERVITVEPRRGMILDRKGRELAVSTNVYSVYAAAGEIAEREKAAAVLAETLELPLRKVEKRLAGDRFVLLKRRVAPDVADRVRALEIPGIHLITESKRFYPRGSLAAHVLGFVVPDQPRLREGLEQRYDAAIRGTPGARVALRDAHGKYFLMKARRMPSQGQDLVISIDEVIQHIAERELAAAIRSSRARSGTVVVLNTPTGEVLAMANWPTFNPNRYGQARASARRNRAVTDYYEPGSTFKMVTAAAALEEGLVRPSEIIDCENGSIQVAGKTIRDHKSFSLLSFTDTITESSNVCAIKVGSRLEPRVFHEYATRFGFGSKTGIDLPLESRGLLRHPSRWTATSQAYLSFGQEIGVNAVQIASAFSTIANRGVAVQPRIVGRILHSDGSGYRVPERPGPRRVIRKSTADLLVDLMEGVVNDGTGKLAGVPGFRVAGKTGTAQKIVDKKYSEKLHVASFAGFIPSRRPVLTIHVVLHDPRTEEYHGGDVAAPVFSRIAAQSLDYLGVEPDRRGDPPVDIAGLGGTAPGGGGNGSAAGAVRWASSANSVRPRPLREAGVAISVPARSGAGEPAAAEGGAPVVPDLTGIPLKDALIAGARAGLHLRARGHGFVVSQSPKPGSPVETGATITVRLGRLVARGPAGSAADSSR